MMSPELVYRLALIKIQEAHREAEQWRLGSLARAGRRGPLARFRSDVRCRIQAFLYLVRIGEEGCQAQPVLSR